MSKKKNTLKDLDEFLKQQAATLVTPSRLNEKEEKIQTQAVNTPIAETPVTKTATVQSIINDIQSLSTADDYRTKLCDIILGAVEPLHNLSPEDKVLINTALYLKHGEHWKEALKAYWNKHQ